MLHDRSLLLLPLGTGIVAPAPVATKPLPVRSSLDLDLRRPASHVEAGDKQSCIACGLTPSSINIPHPPHHLLSSHHSHCIHRTLPSSNHTAPELSVSSRHSVRAQPTVKATATQQINRLDRQPNHLHSYAMSRPSTPQAFLPSDVTGVTPMPAVQPQYPGLPSSDEGVRMLPVRRIRHHVP